jgi:hypothetical protein
VNTFKKLVKLYKLKRKVDRNRDTSYAGEFGHLDKLLSSLNLKGGTVVDIAAGDGCNQSSTLGFFRRKGWSGLAVEMDPLNFSKLSFLYADYPEVRLSRSRVTPMTVEALLASNEIPKNFELLNLDIDSYDLHIIEAMLCAGYCPKVITMEVNEKIPASIYFTVNYDDAHYWKNDHFYGCSLAAAADVVVKQGYILSSLEYNNAIFIRADVAGVDAKSADVVQAYAEGYASRSDRKTLFPWNHNVECLQDMEPQKAVDFLRTLFSKYDGQFTLKLV